MTPESIKHRHVDRDAPLYDRIVPITDGTVHLVIDPDGKAWLALRGKATQLRGDDLARVEALLAEGLMVRRVEMEGKGGDLD